MTAGAGVYPLPRAVVLLSGGMDSTTLLYVMAQEYNVAALSIDYGQRHVVELDKAAHSAFKVDASWKRVTFGEEARSLLSGTALTGGGPVPEGHYAAENMAQTVVPNRNAIMLALAYAYAVKVGAAKVCTAVHSGDHAIYPDCRPEFIRAFEAMQRQSITREIYGMKCPDLYAPFVNITKTQIARIGEDLGVPWGDTWSCYQGGQVHCGRCGTCVERIEAFRLAGITDPTTYEDTEFAGRVLSEEEEKHART